MCRQLTIMPRPLIALGTAFTREAKIRPSPNQLRPLGCGCLLDAMPGASEQTRRVKIVNANWVAGPDGDHGRFELQIVTEDGQRHVAAPSAAAMTALIALTQADTVLAWDPDDRTLIAANLVGRMPWTERTRSSPPPG
jgi:hypothetical protein